jgi:hypothetical protein
LACKDARNVHVDKENDMSHISSTERWGASASRWDASTSKWNAALTALSIALVALSVLVMTGVFNPNTPGDGVNAEAIQHSLDANNFSSAPGLVWKRSIGQEP